MLSTDFKTRGAGSDLGARARKDPIRPAPTHAAALGRCLPAPSNVSTLTERVTKGPSDPLVHPVHDHGMLTGGSVEATRRLPFQPAGAGRLQRRIVVGLLRPVRAHDVARVGCGTDVGFEGG